MCPFNVAARTDLRAETIDAAGAARRRARIDGGRQCVVNLPAKHIHGATISGSASSDCVQCSASPAIVTSSSMTATAAARYGPHAGAAVDPSDSYGSVAIPISHPSQRPSGLTFMLLPSPTVPVLRSRYSTALVTPVVTVLPPIRYRNCGGAGGAGDGGGGESRHLLCCKDWRVCDTVALQQNTFT